MSCTNDIDNQAAKYRNRNEFEDNMLNSRTNLFLVVNGLGAVAVELANEGPAQLVITVVVLLINVLWIICALQSLLFIKALLFEYQKLVPDDPVVILHKKTLGTRYWLRPTVIMACYVPLLVFIGWFAGLSMLLLFMRNC